MASVWAVTGRRLVGDWLGTVRAVSFYGEQVLPRLVDRVCAGAAMGKWRSEATAGLCGRVLEVGFGSGLNIAHYPAEVDLVLAVEPAAVARRLALRRTAGSKVPVEHAGADGQSIGLADASCDSALLTFTLCTVPDPAAALGEIRRVLRPGGALHFLEHGISPDRRVAAWQRRLEPLQRRVGGNCHLTRDAATLVAAAGFELERCRHAYATGPRPWSYFTVGVGVAPR
jgi:SAM-dependent methyltransferase